MEFTANMVLTVVPEPRRVSDREIPKPYHGMKVSEEDYWAFYYEYPDRCFEWCAGKLEEVGVSDLLTLRVYKWLISLLHAYLESFPVAEMISLETGFRLADRSIRKPDLGIIHQDNPLQMQGTDKTYHGIFDLCIEALSDSTKKDEQRDTVKKFQEYADVAVKEYFILHDTLAKCAFYRLGENRSYVPIVADNGIIRSEVLRGFQFRVIDLIKKPLLITLINDPVYQGFVMLDYQRALKEKNNALQEKNIALKEKDVALKEKQEALEIATQEKRRAEAAELELAKLRAMLLN